MNLSIQLENLSVALAGALETKDQNILRATTALVAEQLQKVAAPAALQLESPKYVITQQDDGETEIVAIDLRGILPHKGKIS